MLRVRAYKQLSGGSVIHCQSIQSPSCQNGGKYMVIKSPLLCFGPAIVYTPLGPITCLPSRQFCISHATSQAVGGRLPVLIHCQGSWTSEFTPVGPTPNCALTSHLRLCVVIAPVLTSHLSPSGCSRSQTNTSCRSTFVFILLNALVPRGRPSSDWLPGRLHGQDPWNWARCDMM